MEKLKEIVAGVLNLDPAEIRPEMTFLEDLGADSLDVFQIIMDLEEAYGVKIEQDKVEKISTVGEAAELIKAAKTGA